MHPATVSLPKHTCGWVSGTLLFSSEKRELGELVTRNREARELSNSIPAVYHYSRGCYPIERLKSRGRAKSEVGEL